MKIWNVLIVDDEPIAQGILERYVAKLPNLHLVGKCKNCKEAFKSMNHHQIDLVLMDINMPGINGIEFIKLWDLRPLVIFTTAYTEYAFESYDLEAVDYLLKPISFERFKKAIDKLADYSKAKEKQDASLKEPALVQSNMIFIKTSGKLLKIDLQELWLIESQGDYIKLYIGNKTVVAYSSMKSMEQKLSVLPHFLRVNKSVIVNFKAIREIEGNNIKVNDQSVNIGPTFKDRVSQYLKHYTIG